jgi:hypothetical protein
LLTNFSELVKELDLQKSDVAKWKLNFITDVENLQKTLQQPSDINKLTRKLDQLRLKNGKVSDNAEKIYLKSWPLYKNK